ncbi:MAG: hypothetical protein AB2462_07540 [Thermoanaerobacter sp.]
MPSKRRMFGVSAKKHFGKLAGWVQTASYVLDKIYCRKKRCSECGIREICYEKE